MWFVDVVLIEHKPVDLRVLAEGVEIICKFHMKVIIESFFNVKQVLWPEEWEDYCVGKMEKTLNRIHPVSDPEATYFLQVSWEKDLGTGFGLLLSDCQCAWTGTVSESDISTEAADIEMDREKYVEELRKALIAGEESAGKYNFVISRDEQNKVCHFSYERNLKDGSLMNKQVPPMTCKRMCLHLLLPCFDGMKAILYLHIILKVFIIGTSANNA
ncbi:hypothetical protein DV515_00011730 [Chloebia gouldiae]|uniref:XRCC4 N-terminal domain-containing protein n=1 Tax=Chloebia gouldiae TaxID=44316 RepID=A0A3L8S6N4_CHLGU|nr:hypothetical protein DV515_00011730 [Chloebia gouldiae]